MSYTLRGRIESRLAALLPVVAAACVLAAAEHRWWPVEAVGLMLGAGIALDVLAYDRLLRYQPGWAAAPLGLLELGLVLLLMRVAAVAAPVWQAVALFAGGWLTAQALGHAGFPLLRLTYAEDGGELGRLGAATAVAIVRARRRAEGAERAAVTALGIGLAAFAAHTVVDMDWNFVATCGPLLLLAGALVGRAAPSPRAAAGRRPLLAAACVVFALGAFYSLAAPWLAQRELDSATSALGRSDLAGAISHAKRAHSWDPLSTSVLLDWAAFEDDAPLQAQDLYRKAVSLEPQSSEVWFALGDFYWAHGAWKPAYDAYSNAWQYDRFGPAGRPCGALDVARHKVLGTWPASCPRGRPRAATP